ncbi:TetR/AcrR family transcriptional regulator C-terminal domain-containing protein [Pediococcus argentinicus]|uniref:TetR family transcriptional regulator n=1 Tax=Pediococcus argentinicus TaxID=480391 RepID=A0A0R2NHD7_9LACO|nr:TetR/AcrR family transcriptional regulator C-terminal domain-containing protein [Pediococcus argentinicus]KRO25209.1 TetR family transcriptional regulator [Pediococcus argentinicus]NKZ22394.1 TetR family transcriptional regulator [Pediococcus argentinicus]GEP19468.1 transcriptional regulator [Pediococcus argentinicus]
MDRTTCEQIVDATKRLVLHQDFGQVSVVTICKEAGISRQTFYDYFHDKYDVLAWIYQNDVQKITVNAKYQDWQTILKQMLAYFEQERTLYQKMFQITGQNAPDQVIHDHLMDLICSIFNDLRDRKVLMVHTNYCDFVRDLLSTATANEVKSWILSSHPRSLKQETEMLEIYIEDGINGLLLRLKQVYPERVR